MPDLESWGQITLRQKSADPKFKFFIFGHFQTKSKLSLKFVLRFLHIQLIDFRILSSQLFGIGIPSLGPNFNLFALFLAKSGRQMQFPLALNKMFKIYGLYFSADLKIPHNNPQFNVVRWILRPRFS